jgi:glucosamine--fructose-6-phosphate aminotransferase (isomerizing)
LISQAADPQPEQGTTLMYAEAGEAGAAVERFLAHNGQALAGLGARLRATPPSVVVTCARGSSDHAATYAKYMIETLLGVPTVSAAFSTVSLYDAPISQVDDTSTLCIAISQSGRSPDMLATVARYRESGAMVVALVNDETSPLADAADVVLPLCAGPERSVAATKSYITSLAGIAAIVAAWRDDAALAADIAGLPALIERSFALDWSSATAGLRDATSLFLVSRGYGLAIAQEAALKLKETCGLHGEAFSSAEVRHGPMAIVQAGFPVIAFDTGGIAGEDVRALADVFAERGACVWLASNSAPTEGKPHAAVQQLPAVVASPELAPIAMIASFYKMVNALALSRGYEPDQPPFLAKVTQTR